MNDQEILDLCKKGERQQAFNILVRTYSERMYWHARQMVFDHDDANDIIQNSFIKVWEALPNFRGDSKLYTWLYRIVANESLTFLKKRHTRSLLSFESYSQTLENKLIADPLFNGNKIQLALQKAIATLPPKQRNVFILKYFQELKYEEISEITGISVGSLKASYHHAFEKVKNFILQIDRYSD